MINHMSEYRLNSLIGKTFVTGDKIVEIFKYFKNQDNIKVFVLKSLTPSVSKGWTSKTVRISTLVRYKGVQELLKQDLTSKLNQLLK